MALGKNKKHSPVSEVVAVPQTGNKSHPFSSLACYMPSSPADTRLYMGLREAVPVIDAAINKLVRLLGEFTVVCEDKRAEKELSYFLENVSVGGTRNGISAFIGTYFEQLLTMGTAVGEMVINSQTVTHLFNSPLESVYLCEGKSPLDIVINAESSAGKFTPVKYPELILLSVHNPEPGKIYGTSVLKGLPFVSDILMKIFNTVGINWERVGNVRFAVTYKPQNDAIDKAYARERALQVADEWSNTMKSGGAVKDFVAVGDVSIKAIGADNQILDSDVPVRQILEQIVAKLGIPPFLLGFNWSTSERMSYQQADILTSEIDAYRRELTPVINRICRTFLNLHGYDCDFTVEWENLTLQDIKLLAQSELYKAQSDRIYWEMGGEKDGNDH
ncbi:MAG: serine/threonine protein phosphatase [Clostridia bacterium]|nr:serine/threonine protein phosphatase [Clostridia bacterium]